MILYRYILKSFIGPLVLTFVISLFILVMQFLWKYVDDMVGKGLDWFIILELLFYAGATFVPLALPLAILFASLMTFGNLGEKYELVAMKAAGVSLSQTMKPLIALIIFISLTAFFFSNNILPVANLKMFTLLNDVRQKKPALNIRPGLFYHEIDGIVIKVASKDRDGRKVEDVLIYDYTSTDARRNNELNLTLAEKGFIDLSEDERYMYLTLVNGVNYFENIEHREQLKSRPLQRTTFQKQQRKIDLSAFAFSKTNEEFFKDDFRMLSLRQLEHTIDSLYENYSKEEEIYQYDILRTYRNIYVDTITTPGRRAVVGETTTEKMAEPEPKETVSYDQFDAIDRLSFTPIYSDSLAPELLNNFTKGEQKNIITTSLQLARSAKENIRSRNTMLNVRMRLIRKYEIEWHRKFTLSFACLILFFVGAPLGSIIRKGGLGMPAVMSVVLFILFHVLSMTGDKLARESTVTPAAGMWMASLIILPVGIFLTFKATSDAAILDADTYLKFFKKVLRLEKDDQSSSTNK